MFMCSCSRQGTLHPLNLQNYKINYINILSRVKTFVKKVALLQ